MPDDASPCPPATALDRRHLLRGGAVLAGAAGATVLGAVAATPASAAVGDPVLLGTANLTTNTTALAVAPGTAPALTLTNEGGPTLHLEPVARMQGELAVGDVVNTELGPVVGIDPGDGAGVESVFLATDLDVDALPAVSGIRPTRVLDTRWKGPVPAVIVGQSAGALDSQRRLTSGAYIDVAIAPADSGFWYTAVFANFTVTGAISAGQLVATLPDDEVVTFARTQTTTVNYQAKQSASNSAFLQVGMVNGFYAIRVFVSKTAHVAVDITGWVAAPDNTRVPSGLAARVTKQRTKRRAATAAKLEKAVRSVAR